MKKQKRTVTIGKAFRDYIWPRRYLVLVGLILIIISRVSGLVLPGASKYLIDNVIVNKDLELLKIILLVTGSAIFTTSNYLFCAYSSFKR